MHIFKTLITLFLYNMLKCIAYCLHCEICNYYKYLGVDRNENGRDKLEEEIKLVREEELLED